MHVTFFSDFPGFPGFPELVGTLIKYTKLHQYETKHEMKGHDAISMGLPIFYFKVSQADFSKL